MSTNKPFIRTVRQLSDGSYNNGGNAGYIKDPRYANSPERYIRGYLLILSDIQKLFEYVEPADKNKETYSYRIHELFLRVCIEVEANCRAILSENGYNRKGNWNMKDYQLIDETHKLSDYVVKIPRWEGDLSIYKPFSRWKEGKQLMWYWQYNRVKHDIHENFRHANIKNLIEATSGLTALICSQFLDEDFSSNEGSMLLSGIGDGMERTVGGLFRVIYPEWKSNDRYAFNWGELKNVKESFVKHNYNAVGKAYGP